MASIPILEWLISINLERYEVNFLHGGYETVDQCLDLTDTDLITLDITSSGHIKVLLANLNILKRLNPGVSKPTNKEREVGKTNAMNDESSTYFNVVSTSSKDFESGQDGQIYDNIQFGQTPPVKDRVSQSSESTFNKKPIPAPRTKSCTSQPQDVRSDKDVIEHADTYDGFDIRCDDRLNSSNERVCEDEIFTDVDAPTMPDLNRSASLPNNSLLKNEEIPSYESKPSTYVNVVRPFNTGKTDGIDDESKNDLFEYENLNYKKENILVNVYDNQYLHNYGVKEVPKDSFPTLFAEKSPTQDQSHWSLTREGFLLSDVDLSYLENLSNEKIIEEDLLDETSDSLPSRQSLPPPSYPPPPLIISGKEIKDPSEPRNRLYPSLPPRPEKKSSQPKHDAASPIMKPAVSPDISQYCTPPSPSKPIRPLPNIPKPSPPNIPSSPSIPPPLMPKGNSTYFTKEPEQTVPAEYDLYCLETQPNIDDITEQHIDDMTTYLPIKNMTDSNVNNDFPKADVQPARQAPTFPSRKPESFSKLEGYLTRQGGENKWFVLDRESLSCYNNEKKKSPVDIIPVRRIASLSAACDNKCALSFEIFLKSSNSSNSSMLLTADNVDSKFKWLNKIAKLIACVCEEDLDKIHPFERAGNVYIKSAIDSNLQWLHLTGKSLYIYKEDDKFHHLDLRKIQTFRNLSPSKSTKLAAEESAPIQVEVPDMKISFQGHTKLDTTAWSKSINNAINKLDPANLYDHFLTPSDVPVIIDKCVSYVALNGLEVEGIYRLSGQNSKVTKLLEIMNGDARGATMRPDDFQIHDVSNCLKRFFRQLNEPLFTRKFYSYWVEALAIKDMDKRLTTYKNLFGYLPKVNYSTIKFIVTHLVQVTRESDSNKMDSINISSIFGPILISIDKGDVTTAGYQSTNHEISVVKDFLDNHEFLFDIDQEEMERDRMMREARKKIAQLNEPGLSKPDQPIQSLLVSVTIDNDSEEHDVTVSVSPTTTSLALEGKIKEKLGCRDYKDWRLFEVVCDGELERLVDHEEMILSLLLKYKDWPQELCAGNSLVYKRSNLLHNLLLSLEPKMCLWDDLKFAVKKSFKRFYFEFTRCNLSYRKDPKSSTIESWRIEDLVIYKGIQKKRNPPNDFGLTFYPLNIQLSGNILGYSLCFHNQMEMYRWLAVLLNAQGSNGIFAGMNHKQPSTSWDSCPDLLSRVGSRPLVTDQTFDLDGPIDQDSNIPPLPTIHRTTTTIAPPNIFPRGMTSSNTNLMTATTLGNEPQTKTSAMSKFISKFSRKNNSNNFNINNNNNSNETSL